MSFLEASVCVIQLIQWAFQTPMKSKVEDRQQSVSRNGESCSESQARV